MSDVNICNSALIKLGVETITALSDNTRQAKLCNEQYNKLRKSLLREHPWNFAVKRASLTASMTAPAWGFSHQFALPNDYLRLVDLEYTQDKYQIENSVILANRDTLNLRYIYDVTDTTKFTSDFSELLAMRIAVDLSYVLVQSNSLTQQLVGLYDRKLRDVRSFDGQENPAQDVTDDLFILSRL